MDLEDYGTMEMGLNGNLMAKSMTYLITIL